MAVVNVIDYEKEHQENQKVIRDRILESMNDIAKRKGRDSDEFFNELENRYNNA